MMSGDTVTPLSSSCIPLTTRGTSPLNWGFDADNIESTIGFGPNDSQPVINMIKIDQAMLPVPLNPTIEGVFRKVYVTLFFKWVCVVGRCLLSRRRNAKKLTTGSLLL
jgi:hypothetical protein